MDITPYVDSLRSDLVAAAEAGGDDIKQAAERLVLALAPAARLALMEAISQAAAEITAELPDGGVDVRLDGRELDFVVHVAAPTPPAAPAPAAPGADDADEGGLARITLRIPESVKARAEEMAARAGDSLNTWLVKVVRAATHGDGEPRDVTSIPLDAFDPFRRSNRRMSGWL